jgi:hypothetical protein
MKIGRKGFQKGVLGETKNAGVRTQKRGGYLGKNHAPLLQVKWLVPNYNFEFVDTRGQNILQWNTEKNVPRYVVYKNSKLTNENIQNY